MDTVLWVLLIIVVVGALWWFRSRRPSDSAANRSEVDHERPTMSHGLSDAVPQPPLVMNSSADSGLNRPPAEPEPVDEPAPAPPPAAAEPDPPVPPARRSED